MREIILAARVVDNFVTLTVRVYVNLKVGVITVLYGLYRCRGIIRIVRERSVSFISSLTVYNGFGIILGNYNLKPLCI